MKSSKALYPTDLFCLAAAVFFAACSFLNAGKLRVSLAGWMVDREILVGLLMLLLAAALPLLFRLTNPSGSRLVQFARLFYPQLLYAVFFQEAILLSQLFFGGRSLDPFFARADALLFGFQPAIVFHQVLPQGRLVVELFFFSYFFYYLLITAGWWVLFARGRYREASRALAITTVSFFLMFAFFVFFPVQGPKYYFPQLRQAWYSNFEGLLFTSFLQGIFDRMNLAGAAFPSSHVAIATVALLLNRQYTPRLAVVFLPFTLLLYVSTVYLYAHYAVDVIGGLACGILFWFLIPRLLKRARPLGEWAAARVAALYGLEPVALPAARLDTCW